MLKHIFFVTTEHKSAYLCKQLSLPHGMVISQEGHLIVTEWLHDCITIINIDSGEVINRFGKRGSGNVEFNFPNGVALTQDGCINIKL